MPPIKEFKYRATWMEPDLSLFEGNWCSNASVPAAQCRRALDRGCNAVNIEIRKNRGEPHEAVDSSIPRT